MPPAAVDVPQPAARRAPGTDSGRRRSLLPAAVRFARDGAADNVDDGQCAVAAALRLAQRGQRVRRFSGLRNHEQHGVALQRRVAITKLVRKLDFHRNLREFLDHALERACFRDLFLAISRIHVGALLKAVGQP